ncbi:3',5'-cyclic-nucleotide phosphodiesterase [Purpureocillium takamizusanense]|uniref:Phosphodiesterase n=1 Tax=Purpureocillium takamizusanense TaxID=2060973 RepID=A0A9Q8Q8C4_9HYPO|nr:3',5'-cyclic-nucleotide phosphodiesterase [Purpureocillium takamizusanense]UNI14414.1 3',5'-cyclic-nucleotide phosphodiesterase [Purpureocillium takamizusanense]
MDIMDRLACHVIYVNRGAAEDRLIQATPGDASSQFSPGPRHDGLRETVQPLLDAFGDVHVCATANSCLSKLFELQDDSMMDMTPTLVLLDTPHDQHLQEPRTLSHPSINRPDSPSLTGTAEIHTPDEELYGLTLLQKIITEAHLRSMSRLVVPVPLISYPNSVVCAPGQQMTDGAVETTTATDAGNLAFHRQLIRRCLDLGAVDVIVSPLSAKCVTSLEICAYKAHRDAAREQQAQMEIAKGRKRSWVGVNEQKPFAYLREAMVSGLMNGICRMDEESQQIASAHVAVSAERQADIAVAVGEWHFCAHSFSDDELLVAALVMFKHALTVPDLERWRIPTDQLISFLVACRAAYNSFVPYHNFRHVVDVLQATFNFLVHIGALPAYSAAQKSSQPADRSPLASLLSPFESLTLLITAIGHDVGHPGVNNGFLSTLNAPLAQLYNDRSVLESFHCAAYSQILRRYWPAAFEDRKMRNLMISSILATDMGLHFDYMKKLGDVQEKLHHNNSTEGWNGRQQEESKALACSLLIKCADISNVARKHSTALQWMHILAEEFSRQASMEDELQIKTSLMATPKKDLISLATAQLGFMNMFAIPLFQGVADIMPAMRYTVEELETNKILFEHKVQEAKASQLRTDADRIRAHREGTFSPRTRSFVADAENGSKAQGQPAGSPRAMTDGVSESDSTPTAMNDVERHGEQPLPTAAALHGAEERKGPNGLPLSFDLAGGDGTSNRNRGDSGADSKTSVPSAQQRCSEATDGSATGAFAGDWQSQATSAATGKAALSPSTQGTSIVSNDSMERTLSAPGVSSPRPGTSNHSSPTAASQRQNGRSEEGPLAVGSIGKAEGKSLKKKPSRFRMKDFPFFRRNKGSNPSVAGADTPT